MTEREKRLWDAAFAAACVGEMQRVTADGFPLERFAEIVTARSAVQMADCAVLSLQRWRRQMDAAAGRMVRVVNVEKEG